VGCVVGVDPFWGQFLGVLYSLQLLLGEVEELGDRFYSDVKLFVGVLVA